MLLGMSVRECQQKIDSAEFVEWIAYFNLEAMPDSWLQHGILCQLIANALGSKTAKPSDFMPKVRKQQSADDMKVMVKAWAQKLQNVPIKNRKKLK